MDPPLPLEVEMTFQIGRQTWADTPSCDLSFAASPTNVRFALILVGDFLERRGLAAARDDVALALGEALNNIEEHAYADRSGGPVVLRVASQGARVMIDITDYGAALPDKKLPAAMMPELDNVALNDLPEGGFGWALIGAISESISYERRDNENRLAFSIAS